VQDEDETEQVAQGEAQGAHTEPEPAYVPAGQLATQTDEVALAVYRFWPIGHERHWLLEDPEQVAHAAEQATQAEADVL